MSNENPCVLHAYFYSEDRKKKTISTIIFKHRSAERFSVAAGFGIVWNIYKSYSLLNVGFVHLQGYLNWGLITVEVFGAWKVELSFKQQSLFHHTYQ